MKDSRGYSIYQLIHHFIEDRVHVPLSTDVAVSASNELWMLNDLLNPISGDDII